MAPSIPFRCSLFTGELKALFPNNEWISSAGEMSTFSPFYSQNVSNSFTDLENTHSLDLRAGQSFLLSSPSQRRRCARLVFNQGIARVAGSFGGEFPDITLGFCGYPQKDWIRLPGGTNL